MKRNSNFYLMVCAAMILGGLFMGCSSTPDMQIEAASAAMKEMESLDAADYAVKEAKEAQAAWDQAQKLLAANKNADAKMYLLKAKGQADLAIRMSKSARDLKKRETESWAGTIDVRFQGLKDKYQAVVATIKPEQKKEMEEMFAKIEQTKIDLAKQLEGQHYYKTADLSHKIMGIVNEGEALLREVSGGGKK
jgi:hypothetical protein